MQTSKSRERFNKAISKPYVPPQNEYSELASSLIGIVPEHNTSKVTLSLFENALAHAYMCGYASGGSTTRPGKNAEREFRKVKLW